MKAKLRPTPNGVVVTVYVHPSANRDTIVARDEIEVYTSEPPEGNRANAAVIKMLSRALGIPRQNITIIRGSRSRTKEVYITAATVDLVEQLIGKRGVEKAQG